VADPRVRAEVTVLDAPARTSHVQSVDRAIALLKAVASASGAEASVPALAQRCGLNRATAWRLLTTLEAQGMVVRDPDDGSIRLGPAVAELAAGLRHHHQSLVEAAHPTLERLSLETGEIACLGVVDGDEVHYLAEVIPSIVHERSWLGEPVSLHASSMGKAFLAYVDQSRLKEVVGDRLPRFTSTTITSLDELRVELQRIRSRGYAICRGELEEGAWGVAAPVLGPAGTPIATLCLWGPERRGDRARLEALGRLARRAARELRIA
jgi:IclR family acetate operon transcriptional repressor